MKKFYQALAIGICLLYAVTPGATAQEADEEPDHLEGSIAIIDALLTSIDEEHYVREILIRDFSRSARMPVGIGLDEQKYMDDGRGNDRLAGDGIYTSVIAYTHDDKNPFDKVCRTRSVMESAVVDDAFRYGEALSQFLSGYGTACKTGDAGKLRVSVSCNIRVCWCSPQCWCMGCYQTPAIPFSGIACVKLTNCKIEIVWT